MKQLSLESNWPASWQHAFACDSTELWGSRVNLAYTYYYQRRFQRVIDAVSDLVPTGSTILDLAAGQGNFSLALAELGYRVTWNDLRAELEGYVRLKHEYGDIAFEPGNALEPVPARDGHPYDGVIAAEIIEHVAHPDVFLQALRRLVRPGGLVFVTTPNGGYVRTGLPRYGDVGDTAALEAIQFQPGAEGHLFLFTDEELRALATGAGFEIVRQEHFITPVLAGELRLGKLFRVLPRRAVERSDLALSKLPAGVRRRMMLHSMVILRRPGSTPSERTVTNTARARLTIVREALEDRELSNYLPLADDGYSIDLVTSRRRGPYAGGGLGLGVTRRWQATDLVRPGFVERRLRPLVAKFGDPEHVFGLARSFEQSDVVCVNETHLASSAQACRMRASGATFRVVVVCYENIPFRYEEDPVAAARKRQVRAAADCFVATTPAGAAALETEGVDAARVVVQPFGVDPVRFAPSAADPGRRASWGVREGELVVLYAGRLLREKGLTNLLLALDACRDLPLRLVMVGSGPEEPRLRRLVSERDLPARVSFVPWVDASQMPAIMASADVFAMPSLPTPYWEEQLGYSLIEAMACGVPVLSTAGASIPFVVGAGGILVRPYDVDDLANGLRALATDAALRSRMGAEGRARVETELNPTAVARTWAGLLGRLR